jgi:hypothetical protein
LNVGCAKNCVANLREDLLDPGETGKAKVKVYPYICEQYDSDSIVFEHAAYLSGPYGLHERLERWNCELLALDNESIKWLCRRGFRYRYAVMTSRSYTLPWRPVPLANDPSILFVCPRSPEQTPIIV